MLKLIWKLSWQKFVQFQNLFILYTVQQYNCTLTLASPRPRLNTRPAEFTANTVSPALMVVRNEDEDDQGSGISGILDGGEYFAANYQEI